MPVTGIGSAAATDAVAALASLLTSYEPLLQAATTYTYNSDGTVATETTGGVATTYTYNSDGTVATAARSGITRTYTWNSDGTLGSVA